MTISQNHTRCPYTLEKLSRLNEVNDEHIFQDALGGLKDYSLRVCSQKNAQLGTLVDAPFLNFPLIAAARTQHGIRSRSGAPKWTMKGTIEGKSTKIDITFPHKGDTKYYVRTPFEWDASGEKGTITVLPEKRDKFIEDLLANCAKKEKEVEILSETRGPIRSIKVCLEFDMIALQRGLAKIAFLAAFKTLGDAFLDDPLISEWHHVIFSEKIDRNTRLALKGKGLSDRFNGVLFPSLKPYEHATTVVNLNQSGPIAAVALFGGEWNTMFEVSSTSNYHLGALQGDIWICDTRAARTRRIPFEEHFVGLANDPKRLEAIFRNLSQY